MYLSRLYWAQFLRNGFDQQCTAENTSKNFFLKNLGSTCPPKREFASDGQPMYVRIRRVYRLARFLNCAAHTKNKTKILLGAIWVRADRFEPKVRGHRKLNTYVLKVTLKFKATIDMQVQLQPKTTSGSKITQLRIVGSGIRTDHS